MTAYQRRKGKAYTKSLLPYAECVMYLPLTKHKITRQKKIEAKWRQGVYVGIVDDQDEVVIATTEGCIRARSVKRLRPDLRY